MSYDKNKVEVQALVLSENEEFYVMNVVNSKSSTNAVRNVVFIFMVYGVLII